MHRPLPAIVLCDGKLPACRIRDHLPGHAGCGRFRFKPLPGDVRIARAAELRDHALDTQSQLVGPPERLASPEYAVAKPRAACRAVQALSRAWLFVDAEPWQLGSSAQRPRFAARSVQVRGRNRRVRAACQARRTSGAESGQITPSSLFVPLEARILRRRLADLLHHAGVDGPRLLAPEPDQLDLEPPLVAVVEQEEHRLAHLGKGGAEPGPPDAPHAPVGLAEVGEQLVALLGVVVAVAEAAVEAEGVVEVEAEGADDGRGEVLEGGAARELEVAVEAAAQGGAEDARARIGHARPPAGGGDAGAELRPVPDVGGGQRAGSDRRQPLEPVAA